LKPLAPAFHEDVRRRLRERAGAHGLDGLLLLGAGNVRYATGWHFSANERPVGLWLPVDGIALLLVPHLELENALAVPGVEARTYEEFPGERPPVLWMLEEAGDRRMAVDTLGAELLEPARTAVERLDLVDLARSERAVKHPAELELIREAARFADQVLEQLLAVGGDIVRQGGTEADLLADCTGHVRRILAATHGEAFQGTRMGITASIHSGARAALPHGAVTNRRPLPGEPIIAGIGCSLGGYHAESGVTLVLGEIRPEQLRVMEAMAEAGAATVDALERGWPCARVNEVALAALQSRPGSHPATPPPRRPAWSSPASPACTAPAWTGGAPSTPWWSVPTGWNWRAASKRATLSRRAPFPAEEPGACPSPPPGDMRRSPSPCSTCPRRTWC
jgi:Xaa-Pro aminopeptidase